MASIESNRQQGEIAKQQGLVVPVNSTPTSVAPGPPGPRLDPYPASPNPYIRTPLPAISTQQPDQQRNFQSGAVPQDRLIGVPATGNPVVGAQTITNIIRVPSSTSGGISLETNNKLNAIQNVLNLISGTNISLSSDAHGGVTITSTATSGSTNFIPLPNNGLYFMARAIVGTTGLQTIGDSSTDIQNGGPVSVSNGVVPTSTLGVNVPFTVGSIAGTAFNGWYPANSGIFWAGRDCRYQARIVTGGALVFLGFSTGTPSTLRTFPFGALNAVGLYTPGTPTNDWYIAINGFSMDTGVAVNTSALSYVDIIMNDTAGTISFSINGSTPTVVSGMNLTGFTWFPVASFANNNATTISCALEYFYGSQDF